jgi:hypothetical protein
VLGCGFLSASASAEEIALLGGATDTDDHQSGSYAWGLEYREPLLSHLDASLGYLNEGHLPGHHRDGGMLQFWATSGSWRDRFAVALGAGPYVYFDTQLDYNYQGYRNEHGVALIVSGRLSYAFSSRWLALLDVKQVTRASPGTRTVMLGVAYRLEPFSETLDSRRYSDQPDAAGNLQNELGFFVGQTVLNNLSSNKSTDFGFEYRYRWARHVELSTSLLNEGVGAVERHASVIGELWGMQEFLGRRFAVGLGAGPYVALSAYETVDGRVGARVVGLASLTLSWRLTRPLLLRVSWHRAFTSDDEDRDIITAGFALRF